MNIYEMPRDSKMLIEFDDGWHECIFHHPDGMYSYCTIEDTLTEEGEKPIFHLSVMTPMILEDGIYKISKKKSKG